MFYIVSFLEKINLIGCSPVLLSSFSLCPCPVLLFQYEYDCNSTWPRSSLPHSNRVIGAVVFRGIFEDSTKSIEHTWVFVNIAGIISRWSGRVILRRQLGKWSIYFFASCFFFEPVMLWTFGVRNDTFLGAGRWTRTSLRWSTWRSTVPAAAHRRREPSATWPVTPERAVSVGSEDPPGNWEAISVRATLVHV